MRLQIKKPAEAEKYRAEKMAEAQRQRVILEAEASAEALAMKGEAEAFAIEVKAKAEAEQVRLFVQYCYLDSSKQPRSEKIVFVLYCTILSEHQTFML